jgi:hypothetical protein
MTALYWIFGRRSILVWSSPFDLVAMSALAGIGAAYVLGLLR